LGEKWQNHIQQHSTTTAKTHELYDDASKEVNNAGT